MNNQYSENLLRFIGATLYSSLMLQASREMFSRSWYQLGYEEKQAVIQAVTGQVGLNMNFLTPEVLMKTLAQKFQETPVGFQVQPSVSPVQQPSSPEKK